MEIINSEVEVVHNVCIYNKYGYCKFRNFCKFQHFQDICSKVSCDIERCLLRYPKVCSYYEEFSYCKFGSFCSYLHRKQGLRNSEIIHQEQSKLKDDMQALPMLVENIIQVTAFRDGVKILMQTVSNLGVDKILNLENRVQEMGDNSIIYYGAIDELEHDVKVLKVQLSRITCAQNRPSPIHQVLPIASSLSYRPP